MSVRKVAMVRTFYAVRTSPGVIERKYAASIRTDESGKNWPLSTLVGSDKELDDLLEAAKMPRHPNNDEYFGVTDEQLRQIGIDPEALDQLNA